MKKCVAMLAAVGLSATLAACGSGGGESSGASGETAAGGGTVSIWAQGAEADSLPELLKDFTAANPDITVNVTAVPWGSAHDKYQSAIAAGTTPDIGQMGTTWMGEFGGAGAFETVPETVTLGEFYSGVTDSTVVDGKTVGVPWYVDTPVLYYRTDLAEQAGYDHAPATWDELKDLAKAMEDKAGAKFGIALAPKDYQGFMPFAWSNGASLTTEGGSAWTIDTPEMVEAMDYYQSFFTDGLSNPAPSNDAGAYIQDFVDGSVPMFFGGPQERKNILDAGGDGFGDKFNTAVWPTKKTSTSFVGGSDLVVFKDGANNEATWKVVEYLTQADVQAQWFTMTGDLPSVKAAWDDEALTGDDKLAAYKEQLNSVVAPPATTSWAAVQGAGNDVMEKLTVTGQSAQDSATELQSYADGIGTGR